MKNVKITFFLLFTLLFFDFKMIDDEVDYRESYIKSRLKETGTSYQERKYECIMHYSDMYNVDPFIMANLMIAESSAIRQRKSFKDCYGLYQINFKLWNFLLWKIDDGKLGKYIKKKNRTNLVPYFYRIGYNTEMGCYIVSNYYYKYGNYEDALSIYGGWNTGYGKRNPEKREKYINKCLEVQ